MKIANRTEIGTLLNKLNLQGIGIEVGVLEGELSKIILDKWTSGKLFLLDSWRHLEDYDDANNPDTKTHIQKMITTTENIKEHVDRAFMLRMLSEQAVELFPDNYFDFIYIDANHSYEGCKQDIEMWYPKLKLNGLFMIDDYIPDDGPIWITFPGEPGRENEYAGTFGVKKAVNEFTAVNNIRDMYVTDEVYWRQVYWIKKGEIL